MEIRREKTLIEREREDKRRQRTNIRKKDRVRDTTRKMTYKSRETVET